MVTKTHIVKTEEGQIEKAVQVRAADPGSPVSNQTWVNTTDKKMKFYDGSDVQNVGAAGVGSAATFALFQAEDGDISAFSNMSVETGSPIAGDRSYAVDSFPATAPAISVDARRAGDTAICSFVQSIASGSYDVQIVDNSAKVLAEVTLDSDSAQKVIMTFNIPSSATSVQLKLVDNTSATTVIIDDIEFSDNPFPYKNLTQHSYVKAEGNGGTSIVASTTNIDFTEVTDSNGAFNGTAYSVQNPNSVLQLSGSVRFTASGARNMFLYKNAILYKRLNKQAGGGEFAHKFEYTSIKGEFAAGDLLTIRSTSNGGTLENNAAEHYLNIVESWEAEHVVTPAKSTLADEESYDPAIVGLGTTSAEDIFYTIRGDKVLVQGVLTSGTSTATEVQIPLPNSYTIKSGRSKFIAGTYSQGGAASPNSGGFVLATGGDAYVNLSSSGVFYTTSVDSQIPATGLFVATSGRKVAFTFEVPVNELTSQVTFLAAVPVEQCLNITHDSTGKDTVGSTTGYKTRDIVSLGGDVNFASINSNQLTLPPGKYVLTVNLGWLGDCGNCYFGLYNISDSSYIYDKLVSSCGGAGDDQGSSVTFQFTIGVSTILEFRTRVSQSAGSTEVIYDSFLRKLP